MDILTAFAVLGLRDGCTLQEARRTYRSRALLLHPDRVEAGLRTDAAAAMAQLNEAWEVVRAHLLSENPSSAGLPRDGAQQAQGGVRRGPVAGECDLCGCAPARWIRQRRITGLLLGWRSATGSMELCRGCGNAFYTETQVHCLTKGWWGALACYANLVVLFLNRTQLSHHQRGLAPARHRAPEVVTPVSSPMHVKPIRSRPAPIVASLVALTLIVVTWATSPSRSPSAQTSSPTGVLGTCLRQDGHSVGCTDGSAAYTIVSEATTASDCQDAAFTSETTNKIYCAQRLK